MYGTARAMHSTDHRQPRMAQTNESHAWHRPAVTLYMYVSARWAHLGKESTIVAGPVSKVKDVSDVARDDESRQLLGDHDGVGRGHLPWHEQLQDMTRHDTTRHDTTQSPSKRNTPRTRARQPYPSLIEEEVGGVRPVELARTL